MTVLRNIQGNLGNHFRLLEIVSRNINARGAFGEVSDRNEKYIFGNWRKGDLCHKVAEHPAALCSTVLEVRTSM